MEEIEVGDDIRGDTVVIVFWDPRGMCVFDIHIVDTYTASYYSKRPHKILYQHNRRKKGKCLVVFLER